MSTAARLIIVCGLPGAGKTAYARALETKLKAVRFSPDEWLAALDIDLYDESARERIENLQWKLIQDLLRLGQTAIVEWGTWSRAERDVLREGARALGASAELHYLDEPVEVLWPRVSSRGAESPAIERADLAAWADSFEAPTTEEAALYDEPTPNA